MPHKVELEYQSDSSARRSEPCPGTNRDDCSCCNNVRQIAGAVALIRVLLVCSEARDDLPGSDVESLIVGNWSALVSTLRDYCFPNRLNASVPALETWTLPTPPPNQTWDIPVEDGECVVNLEYPPAQCSIITVVNPGPDLASNDSDFDVIPGLAFNDSDSNVSTSNPGWKTSVLSCVSCPVFELMVDEPRCWSCSLDGNATANSTDNNTFSMAPANSSESIVTVGSDSSFNCSNCSFFVTACSSCAAPLNGMHLAFEVSAAPRSNLRGGFLLRPCSLWGG